MTETCIEKIIDKGGDDIALMKDLLLCLSRNCEWGSISRYSKYFQRLSAYNLIDDLYFKNTQHMFLMNKLRANDLAKKIWAEDPCLLAAHAHTLAKKGADLTRFFDVLVDPFSDPTQCLGFDPKTGLDMIFNYTEELVLAGMCPSEILMVEVQDLNYKLQEIETVSRDLFQTQQSLSDICEYTQDALQYLSTVVEVVEWFQIISLNDELCMTSLVFWGWVFENNLENFLEHCANPQDLFLCLVENETYRDIIWNNLRLLAQYSIDFSKLFSIIDRESAEKLYYKLKELGVQVDLYELIKKELKNDGFSQPSQEKLQLYIDLLL